MTDYLEQRQAVIAAQNRCRQQRLQTGNGGNVSCRIPGLELMAVKATEASFGDTDISAAVVADFLGNLVAGDRRPTKECLLHGVIYQRMPTVGAIVHCHSPWALGWATSGEPIPCVTYHSALKLLGPVPVIDTGDYVVSGHYVDDVLALLSDPPAKAVVLMGHGLVALGADMEDALNTAELVEETAQVAFLGRLLAKR